MTTQEFLTKAFNGDTRKERASTYSSVYVSHGINDQVTAYSYGYHYPLATIINGKGYVNNRGYSNSTAKHINWAFSALGTILGHDNVYAVKLTNGDNLTPTGIKNSSRRQHKELFKQMASKKRKDTQVYKQLQYEYNRSVQTYNTVRNIKNAPSVDQENNKALGRINQDLKTISGVMALGDLFTDNQKDANDWKTRMLKAGLDGRGLIMPDDWNELDEATKEARLNGAIKILS